MKQPFLRVANLSKLLALMLFAISVGCDSSDKSTNEKAAESIVSTVPLRIISAGDEVLNNRIEAAWKAISEQPIELVSASGEDFVDRSRKSDVVIFANYQMGDLQAENALAAFPEILTDPEGIDADTILPALAADVLPWGPDNVAAPLGTVYPALWYAEGIELNPQPTWDEFTQRLETLQPGQAAEPLADGWAAVALLWRTATLTREMWLFDRQTLEPQIATEPYVRALNQMIEARKNYPDELMNPVEIWQALEAGDLKLAIGWPTVDVSQTSDVEPEAVQDALLNLAAYPMSEQVYLGQWRAGDGQPLSPVLSPFGLSVAVATSCRQTPAARAFVRWIVGREGHASIRGAGNVVLPNRMLVTSTDSADALASGTVLSTDAERSAYDAYLTDTLSNPSVRPSLRIPAADRYLQILDSEILLALAGEKSAEAALQAVAQQWDQLTDQQGRRQQVNAWRQSQGMRER